MKENKPTLTGGVPIRPINISLTRDLKRVPEGFYRDIDSGEAPTPIDLPVIPENTTDEDFYAWISRTLEIERKLIEDDRANEESKKEYEKLNQALEQGRDFLIHVLKYKEREVPNVFLSSKKDLFDLLRKTRIVKRGQGLDRRPLMFCRLVKVAIAAYEANKADARLLSKETTYFENLLISQSGDTPLGSTGRDKEGTRFYAKSVPNLNGVLNSRGKTVSGFILRFLTRPESSAAVALKDGIGLRITINQEGAIKLLPILYNWLRDKMQAGNLVIENEGFIELEDGVTPETLFPELPKDAYRDIGRRKKFEGLKITGIKPFFRADGTSYGRHFEIQLVKPDNQNEKGPTRHYIYDIVKLVIARTRLDGGCPESALNMFIKETSVFSGLKEEKIRNYLMGREDDPIIKISKTRNRRGEAGFIALSVYERWHRFGWIDTSFITYLTSRLKGKK